MTTVLVTAATGTVGRAVVHGLHAAGSAVRPFVRDVARARALLPAGVQLAVGDLGDRRQLDAAMEGADAVFLACANDPRQIEYETNVIDAAAAAGVDRIVKLSAIGAAPGAGVAFADFHGQLEAHLRRQRTASVVLRANFFMSNLLGSVDSIQAIGRFFLPAGDAEVAMVDPADVADVAVAALLDGRHAGRTYELTGPAAITFADVADALSTVLGRRVEYVPVPDDVAHEQLTGAGLPPWLADNLVRLFATMRDGALSTVTNDVQRVTGRPPADIATFLRRHAAALAA